MPPRVMPIEPNRSRTMSQPCAAPANNPSASASSKPRPRIGVTGQDRDAARRAEYADDREIEFTHHHGETKPQRHKAGIAERLQRRTRRNDAQQSFLSGVECGKQHNGKYEDDERPHMRIVPQQ